MEILTGAEVDLFVPSFPDLQHAFSLSPFMVELMLGINLTAHCITALIVGNLGDRYGRKPVILLGLGTFIIGSIFCVFAAEYWQLLLGRFFQGIGISGPAVLAYTLVADMYSVKKQQEIMGKLNGAITLAMAFAPVLGSYVNLFFSWRGNFVILLLLGFMCFVLTALFVPKGQQNSSIKISLRGYLPILKSRKIIYYTLAICFLVQAYWVFIGISPILYIKDLGVSLKQFGLYQGSLAGVFAIISFSTGYFIEKFGTRNCMIYSILLLVISLFACILLIIYNISTPLIITLAMQLLSMGMIFPINILWPLSIAVIPEAKGMVTALFIFCRLSLTTISLQVVGYFYDNSFGSVGIAICISLILFFIFFYKLLKEDKSIMQ